MMNINKTLTLNPFKTEKGNLVKNVGVAQVPDTEKWDKLKKKFVYHWCITVRLMDSPKYQYWIFDYTEQRTKVFLKMPNYIKII